MKTSEQMNPEIKNYAKLRSSRAFGETKIGLRIQKDDFLEWVKSLPADEKGIVKFIIAPRRTPSDSNSFTMFEDTWKRSKENFERMRKDAQINPNPVSNECLF